MTRGAKRTVIENDAQIPRSSDGTDKRTNPEDVLRRPINDFNGYCLRRHNRKSEPIVFGWMGKVGERNNTTHCTKCSPIFLLLRFSDANFVLI